MSGVTFCTSSTTMTTGGLSRRSRGKHERRAPSVAEGGVSDTPARAPPPTPGTRPPTSVPELSVSLNLSSDRYGNCSPSVSTKARVDSSVSPWISTTSGRFSSGPHVARRWFSNELLPAPGAPCTSAPPGDCAFSAAHSRSQSAPSRRRSMSGFRPTKNRGASRSVRFAKRASPSTSGAPVLDTRLVMLPAVTHIEVIAAHCTPCGEAHVGRWSSCFLFLSARGAFS